MISITTQNIFGSRAQALVNPVNLQGVSGAGLALEFKNRFPEIVFSSYKRDCKDGTLQIGKVSYVTVVNPKDENVVVIVNFPTKDHWKDPSDMSYIRRGLESLRELILDLKISSISIPLLGCGLGGLDSDEVIKTINEFLKDLDCEVIIHVR